MKTPTLSMDQFCRQFRCTPQQVEDLRRKNKVQLTEMYAEACRTNRLVRGYTREQIRQLIDGLQLPTT